MSLTPINSQCPVEWTEVDTVLLDMDGTLLDLHYDNYFWAEYLPLKVSERDGLTIQEAKDSVLPTLLETSGTLPFYCIDHWSRVFALDILELKRQVAHKIAVRSGALAFLQHLRRSEKRVVMATNAHRATIDMKLDRTRLHDYFDAISSSHDYGAEKENRLYWTSLVDDLDINLGRSLFIDDNSRVLDSARDSGVGQLIGVRTPDSRREAVKDNGYWLTEDFSELIS